MLNQEEKLKEIARRTQDLYKKAKELDSKLRDLNSRYSSVGEEFVKDKKKFDSSVPSSM